MTNIDALARAARRSMASSAIALLATAHAAPAEGTDRIVERWRQQLTWIADDKGCKAEGQEGLERQAVIWSGACVKGYAQGRGELRLFAGNVLVLTYSGGMQAGRFSGQGVLQVQGYNRYEGTFVDGLMQGIGRVVHPDGTIGTGNFISEKLSGACTLNWTDGDRYEGQCRDGSPSKSGQIKFADGDSYIGAIAWGKSSGQGRYAWANGDTYEGSLTAGDLDGVGEYRFADGSQYVGKFRNHVPWGQGRMQRADGLAFEGEFAAGKPTKVGSFVQTDGTPPQNTPALRDRMQLHFGRPQKLKRSWDPASAESICPRRPAPEVPNAQWTGRLEFRASVVVHNGKVSSVQVKTLKAADDEGTTQQMIASIEKAVRAYECTADNVFVQDFEFYSGK